MEYDRDVLSDEDMDFLREACKKTSLNLERIKKAKAEKKLKESKEEISAWGKMKNAGNFLSSLIPTIRGPPNSEL